MNGIDYSDIKFYESLGFKCGVEIHQQLLTGRKLFCKCPAGKYSKTHDAEILRHMRPTLSELGEYDGCALMEFKTKKEVIYWLNRESVCTYEMDDTPPFMVNHQGLDIVIEIALLLNCSIVDEMHISRKQYLDGSIPTGFQRTAVVGINGWIPYKDRKVRISHICYEEDACREVSDIGHRITFRTDRLGMPLIEVITCADIKTPQEAREVVMEIGRLMRATGKVRRGIGSVRQDVNGSIARGSRVEIKGVPQVSWIPPLLHNEALRQKSLLNIKQILAQRNITENNLNVLKTDLTKVLSKTKIGGYTPPARSGFSLREPVRVRGVGAGIMSNNLVKGNLPAPSSCPDIASGEHGVGNGQAGVIGGIKICGIAGLFNHQTQPTKTFADEIAGRLRVIACIDVMPNFFHTDNYPNYTGSNDDLSLIRKSLQINNDDVGVIVWGSKQDVATALEEVRLRIIDAIRGIPNETRQPFRSGLTDFERILPGPNRMYPDTDSPPTKITHEMITKIKQNLPDVPWQREKRYIELGINYAIARELAISAKASLADKILAANIMPKTDPHLTECPVGQAPLAGNSLPTLVGVVMTQGLKALRRKGVDVNKITDETLFELFESYAQGVFYKEIIMPLIEKLAKDNLLSIKDIITKDNLSVIPSEKLNTIIDQTIKENQFRVFTNDGYTTSINEACPVRDKKDLLRKMTDFYTGKVMKKYKGRINGQILNEVLNKQKLMAND